MSEIVVLTKAEWREEIASLIGNITLQGVPEVMTLAQVAEYLQISMPTLYKAMNERGLPYTEKCGDKRFVKSEVDLWLKSK
jgi:excisionase family DNA binding protein